MGCSSSRLDDLPAVALCRRRRKSIDSANKHFTSLAESHIAYMQSMISIGHTLVRTLSQFPPHAPTDPQKKVSVVVDGNRSNSYSGHIKFTPSSDDEEENEADRKRTTDIGSNYEYLMNGVEERFGGFAVTVYGNQINHMQPPPAPPPPSENSLTWDLMNFFTPYEMPLHYPERYSLLSTENELDAEESKIEIKKVVQVKKNVTSEVSEKKHESEDGKEDEEKEKISSVAAEGEKKLKSAIDALEEVNVLFEKASEAGNGVLKLLKAEADHNYMFHLDSTQKTNLPSILRKLSIWEHKLYTEVKAEEEMRLRHEDLQKRLKKQDEKGSESQKLDATQKAIMTLMPKMKIAFDMVNRISIVISKLRDEELWPCLKDFINELQVMWMALLDCHTQQAKSIKEVSDLHIFPSDGDLTNAQLESAMELKHELQNWIISFCNWISAQKSYVTSLNKWLQRCFLPELKEQNESDEYHSNSSNDTPPLISVICHQWSENMKKIKDDDKVIQAMKDCVTSVDQMLQRMCVNIQQRVIIDGDLEKRVKKMEAKDKEMVKVLDEWKKNVKKEMTKDVSGIILASDGSKNDQKNLQPELKGAVEALETMAGSFVHIYQDLLGNNGENQMDVGKMKSGDL